MACYRESFTFTFTFTVISSQKIITSYSTVNNYFASFIYIQQYTGTKQESILKMAELI